MSLPDIKKTPLFIALGLSFIIGLVFIVLPFVSQKPDGLEKVTEDTIAFLKKDDFMPVVTAPMPKYTAPGIKNSFDAKRYAGIIGVFVVFTVMIAVGYVLKKRRTKSGTSSDTGQQP
ncbi:MAG: PDGLE domain-containing protein [Planctomycetes bacterium]|nr:PDGLE domain-containing protein [Planctomycetota bacterium]